MAQVGNAAGAAGTGLESNDALDRSDMPKAPQTKRILKINIDARERVKESSAEFGIAV